VTIIYNTHRLTTKIYMSTIN